MFALRVIDADSLVLRGSAVVSRQRGGGGKGSVGDFLGGAFENDVSSGDIAGVKPDVVARSLFKGDVTVAFGRKPDQNPATVDIEREMRRERLFSLF